jgi:hypothetical protein
MDANLSIIILSSQFSTTNRVYGKNAFDFLLTCYLLSKSMRILFLVNLFIYESTFEYISYLNIYRYIVKYNSNRSQIVFNIEKLINIIYKFIAIVYINKCTDAHQI